MQHIEPSRAGTKRRKKRGRSRSSGAGNIFSSIFNAILWCEPIWIALLAPLLLFSGTFLLAESLPFVVLALFLFWPIRLLSGRGLFFCSPHNGFLWLLLLWLPVPFLVSTNAMLSWQAVGYLLLGVATYVAITNWTLTQNRPELIAVIICVVGIALAAVGPRLIERVPTKLLDTSEITLAVENAQLESTESINSNVLAGGLLMAVPFLLAFALTSGALGGKKDDVAARGFGIFVSIISAIAFVGVMAVIGLTQSRGAYIAMAVVVCLVILLRWPRTWPVITLIVAAGAGSLYYLDIDAIIGYSAYDNSINSFSGRTEIWRRASEVIRDYPFTGAGIGTFGEVVPALYPYATYADTPSGFYNIPHAHNLLLQIGVDLGMFGLVLTICLFISSLLIFIRTYRKAQSANKQNLVFVLCIGGIGAIVAIWVHGIFDAVTWGTKLAFMPWLVLALATLLEQPHLQPRRKRSSR